MKLKKLLLLPIVLFTITVFSQKSTTFIEIADEEVSKDEFKRVYLKNNSGEVISKSTVDEYLDLYINFKLKVKEAESRGMDQDPEFIKELAGYRKQLAAPYLTAEGIMLDLKKEAYERLQTDINASHILINVSNEASPQDTLDAYRRAKKVRDLLIKGEDFETVAKQYSDDPSAKTNGGNLGYFTAFYMVYPFETAAYNTKEGEISEIVRTQFGYHILKVLDKREAVGNVKVAHLLISNDEELAKTDDPEGKIKEIYKKIQKGAKFEEMVAQFSDDTRTSSQGGELPTFGVGRMVPEFAEVAFALEEDGDISKPFKTPYGWHIIKRLEHYPIGEFKDVEEEMMTRIKKDSRSNLSQGAVINKIKKEYGFKENKKYLADLYSVIDSSYYDGNWKFSSSKKLDKTLFTIGDKSFTQKDFAENLEKSQKKRKAIDYSVLIYSKYDQFRNKSILAYKDAQLDVEYPDFKALMQEYHDGILLFNLTDELVWSKASKDTVGLENFLVANQQNYQWPKRVDAIVFSAANEDVAEQVRGLLKENKKIQEILETVNRPSQLNLKYEKRKFAKGENDMIDKVDWKVGVSKNYEDNGRVSFVKIDEVIEPANKTLEDSRGLITSDYQNYLEKEWIKELRNKYSYKVDQKVLKDLKAELK